MNTPTLPPLPIGYIDDFDEIDDWHQALVSLGIDVDARFPLMAKARSRANKLRLYANRYRTTGQHTHDDLVTQVATQDPGDYEELVTRLLIEGMSANAEVRHGVINILISASDRAMHAYQIRFRDSMPKYIPLLTAKLDEAVADAKHNAIHPGLATMEAAGRAGLGDQWLALERAYASYDAIGAQLGNWWRRAARRNGNFPRELGWAVAGVNLDASADIPRLADHVWLGAAAKAGTTFEIIDRVEFDRRAAAHEQTHANETKQEAQQRLNREASARRSTLRRVTDEADELQRRGPQVKTRTGKLIER